MTNITILSDKPQEPNNWQLVCLSILGFGFIIMGLKYILYPIILLGITIIVISIFKNHQRRLDYTEMLGKYNTFQQKANDAIHLSRSSLPLPIVNTTINLQKNEICHWLQEVKWYELRKNKSSENYALIDTGTLYVTNKRIFFDGQSKNISLKFNSISSVQLFDGGLHLEKQTGRTPLIRIKNEPEIAAACIIRAINNNNLS